MTINVNLKHLVASLLITALAVCGYSFRDSLGSLLTNRAVKKVDQALVFLKDNNPDNKTNPADLFDTGIRYNLFQNYKFYKIDEWKLKVQKIDGTNYKIFVNGTATNAFNAKLQRQPIFLVSKDSGQWLIKDSFDFFILDNMEFLSGMSDMEKHDTYRTAKAKLTIEDTHAERTIIGSMHGTATIKNGSIIPFKFVKLLIEYYDRSGSIVNTDESYAIGADELMPGQQRKVEWMTSNADNCYTYKTSLKFD